MRSSSSSPAQRPTSRVMSVTGRLRNEHFLLTTDHLLLELDRTNFDLVTAYAEGNVEVHLQHEALGLEYVFHSRRAIFRPDQGRLHLGEWLGIRQNGAYEPFPEPRRELILPADGTFFPELPTSATESSSPPAALCFEVLANF